MFKKSRVTDLKHRNTRKKQKTRRILARQLIKGDVSVDQLRRLAGEASNGVLRTVNYLSETEGITLASTLSEAVAQAVTPASSSSSAILARRAAAVAAESRPAPVVKDTAVEVEEQENIEPVTEITIADQPGAESSPAVEEENEIVPPAAVEPPPPKKRTRATTKPVEQPEIKAAPKPRTRAAAKATTTAKEEVMKVAPKKRERVAPKAVKASKDTETVTPKKRTRAPAKPKE